MNRYVVYLVATASHSVEVEADSIDEAEEKAEMLGVPSLCHQCSSHMDLGDFAVSEGDTEQLS